MWPEVAVLSFVADFWEVLKIPLSILTTLHFTTEQQLQLISPLWKIRLSNCYLPSTFIAEENKS